MKKIRVNPRYPHNPRSYLCHKKRATKVFTDAARFVLCYMEKELV